MQCLASDACGPGDSLVPAMPDLVTLRRLLPLLLLALWMAAPASASDYVNVCRSANGDYEIADETLRRVDPHVTHPPLPYHIVRETVLARETGYCTSRDARGQQFKYETRSTALRVRFKDGGEPVEIDFICEFVADGLPAAYNCDERVVTSAATGKPGWMHNGSIMRLDANGKTRRFFYDVPRPGMRNVGVTPGTLLFEGMRDGNTYAGTAYIFAKGCKPAPYAVSGEVSDGDRKITMTGQAPRLAADCSINGTREDTLVFTANLPAGN